MGRKRNKYPREFKIEAVKKLESGEITQAELARRLGVTPESSARLEKRELARKKKDAFPGHGNQRGSAAELVGLGAGPGNRDNFLAAQSPIRESENQR